MVVQNTFAVYFLLLRTMLAHTWSVVMNFTVFNIATYIISYCVFDQVFDQYLNFVSLEDDLFCLCHQNSDRLSYYGKCMRSEGE